MRTSKQIYKALSFAIQAHSGQVRKYTGISYIIHPVTVAEIISGYTDDEDVIVAALLHDVVEDGVSSVSELTNHFGERPASMVYKLTNIKSPCVTREERKIVERQRALSMSPQHKMIRLADVYDNVSGVLLYDKTSFRNVYLSEKRLLYLLLNGCGSEKLYREVGELLEKGEPSWVRP